MELLPFHADVEIGQVIEIPIAMYHISKETKEAIMFTDCSHLSLALNTDKQGVFTLCKEGKRKLSIFSFFGLWMKGPIIIPEATNYSLNSHITFLYNTYIYSADCLVVGVLM